MYKDTIIVYIYTGILVKKVTDCNNFSGFPYSYNL